MSISLSRITLREIRMPLREPFEISSGRTIERRILLLTLEDRDGTTAWSECVAGERPNYSAETIDTAWLAIRDWIAPRVLGTGIAHPRMLDETLRRAFRGHPMAKAAIEMGVWALWAEREGVSLARLLGGTQSTIATGISIGIQESPAALVDRARAALEEGYRRIKVKIRPGADIEYIGAVREGLGAAAPLMADANSAYTLAHADHLADLDAFGLLMIEQPLAQDDLRRHAQLQDRLSTPICLDESIPHAAAAEDMLALAAGRIVNIKPGRVGGFSQAKAIHDLCRRQGVPVWCGGMLESGIGRAHNIALASLPHFLMPGDLSPSARYWTEDIVTPEWTMDAAGRVTVPLDATGLGVAVNVDRIDNLTVRSRTLAANR
ncbi:MAG: o-succinylbenzoate synthase [Acidobacteria bacterium]|nr:o-succinylbenzoate synthase [Acidobacteriota bacterium]